MRGLQRSDPRLFRTPASLLFLPLLAAALASGCATTPPVGDEEIQDVSRLADQLVEAARERVELNRVLVVVQGIHPLRAEPVATTSTGTNPGHHEEWIGTALERGFVIALASRLNVVESEMVAPGTQRASTGSLTDLAGSYGATHLLVGDYRRSHDGLVVSVRLIDAESHIIVAAVVGRVALPDATMGEGTARLVAAVPATASSPSPSSPAIVASRDVVAENVRPPAAPAERTAPPAAAPKAAASTALVSIPASSSGSQPQVVQKQTLAPEPSPPPPLQPASGPVEDFETWRARHAAKPAESSGSSLAREQAVAPAAPRASQTTASADAASFPWRKDGWLAQLLGVRPETAPKPPH